MIEAKATVENFAGIHVRPSGVIIQTLQGYPGKISVKAKGIEIDLSNIMGLIALGLTKGETVDITVDGPDEEQTLATIQELFSRNYDFPPRGSG